MNKSSSKYGGSNRSNIYVSGNSDRKSVYYSSGKKLSKEYIRKIQRENAESDAKGVHGKFCCDVSNKYYGMSFGYNVRFYVRWFEGARLVCLDCIEKMNSSSYCIEE